MPGTIEELEADIQDNISEANSILFLNQNILQEYENRQQKVNPSSVLRMFECDIETALTLWCR